MKLYMDFSVVLAIGSAVCGIIWAIDSLFFKKKRALYAIPESDEAKEPKIVEYAKSFFPILLIVFFLRSFLAEPFRIPSGSMKPTLLVGDFVLVNKFAYGVRLPLFGTKLVEKGDPQRGDVLVFRYPVDTNVNFIKRVVALPGDKVKYSNKTLYINDKVMPKHFQEQVSDFNDFGSLQNLKLFKEKLNGVEHTMYIDPQRPDKTVEIEVPEGHYFVMGDNRDNSDDSRAWGFVPDELIIGKGVYVWMSWDGLSKDVRWKRIGNKIT
tara:strand:- start:80644 stop:81441 length:798 start_codon:yes stop_codon:yes gene_type:complete